MCVCLCVCACVWLCVHVWARVRVCMHVCVCVCVHFWLMPFMASSHMYLRPSLSQHGSRAMIWDPILGCDVLVFSENPVTPKRRIKISPETRRREDQEHQERVRMWTNDAREQERAHEHRERQAMDTEELLQMLDS